MNKLLSTSTALLFLTILSLTIKPPALYAVAENKDADAVAGASYIVDEEWFSLTGDALSDLINSQSALSLLATVNEDGSSYQEFIEPEIDENGILRFASRPSPTRINLDRNNQATLTVITKRLMNDEYFAYLGARLQLKALKDDQAKGKTKGFRIFRLEIEKTLPLK